MMVTNKLAFFKVDKRKKFETNLKQFIEKLNIDGLSAYDHGKNGNEYQRGRANAFSQVQGHIKALEEQFRAAFD